MFLNELLFFSNIIYISFCFKYIRFLAINDKLDRINILKAKYKNKKKSIKKSYNTQLNYIKLNDEVDNHEFKIFHYKVIIFVVAIVMALNIIRTEPIIIFGVKIGLWVILVCILINWLFSIFLTKLGVRY